MHFAADKNVLQEHENLNSLVSPLYSGPEDECLNSVIILKNLVAGSNKQKESVIQAGIVPRLLHLFTENTQDGELVYEIGALLCSLCKGTTKHIRLLVDCNITQMFIKKVTHLISATPLNNKLIEICLRTLRSLFVSCLAPITPLYQPQPGIPFIAYLLSLISPSGIGPLKAQCQIITEPPSIIPNSAQWCMQECVLNILAAGCQTTEHQNLICEYSCLQTIADLLQFNQLKISKPALTLLARLCHENELVSLVAVSSGSRCQQSDASTSLNEEVRLIDQLSMLSSIQETQLEAAKCITYIYRAGGMNISTNTTHQEYIHRTLKVLARLCKKENEPEVRVEAANILAYLTEVDCELQRLTAICDHIIPTLAEYFKFSERLEEGDRTNSLVIMRKRKRAEVLQVDLKEAAFKCFASLGATDEEIRKKIISTDMLMENTVAGLSDESTRIRLAAIKCLHSLSRSVQQLRTTFQDHAVWIPLKALLLGTTDDAILSVASSTLCNVLLEFSPSKQHFLDQGAVDLLCSLTRREQGGLRLNGVWALMNMAFQADRVIKLQIMHSLGIDQIFTLLNDPDPEVMLKTLGLIRNLLSTKSHIDFIMQLYGSRIMEAVQMILQSDLTRLDRLKIEVQEQAICILANIANGDTAKHFIMSNHAVLTRLIWFLEKDCDKLQIASVYCVNNLIWNSEPGAAERQVKLKQIGVYQILQQLLSTRNDALFDRVKTALQQYEKDN